MITFDRHPSGRHALQIPGPTNVPDRVLRAIDNATIDHRGPEFAVLGKAVIAGMKRVFKTQADVVIYPASGTGAWEAALVNTLAPGDHVLMAETGHFATLWKRLAERLGLVVRFMPGDWRHGANAASIHAQLASDTAHAIKAVCVVHNETSTGVVTDVAAIRNAIDRVGHPALLMVDTISSLGSIDYRHDEWRVDVAVAGSQKGLMLPPGLSFNAIGPKALTASKTAKLPRSYWDWNEMLAINATGYFPYTPATNLLYGLHEALEMLLCAEPAEYSASLTAIVMPEGHNADALRKTILDRYDLSLGQGLGKMSGKIFRIGHLGWFNDLMLCGTLCGIEMGLAVCDVPHNKNGVRDALDFLQASGGGKGAAIERHAA